MENLFKGIKLIQEVVTRIPEVSEVRIDQEEMTVQVKPQIFKELVGDFELLPCHVEETDLEQILKRELVYNIKLQFEKEGITFLTVMDQHEFQLDFESWLYDEPNIDETFIVEDTPRGVTNEQWAMKQSGMALKDFM
ncbi:hypothetical protein [Ornithinibacillus scapharcae]|uniref:hypothetical protein n=1 Tax=Ornithinibacillus scapharcae TaxID=1147159 RepID=UPI000225B415|nr:hypothetical protein [Ornithinibacillus scapharcae]